MWGYQLLEVTRLTGIIQTLNEELMAPENLVYLNSVPVVNAVDGDILGTYEGNLVSADIINDDQKAVIRSQGRYNLSTNAIPNFKQGSLITQAMRNLFGRITRNGALRGDVTTFEDYVRNEVATKLASIRVLMNRMIAGMRIDSFEYNKMGVVYKNVSWGMPSDLKWIPSIPWIGFTSTATPVDDLLLWLNYAKQTYGEVYNRIRLSTKAFNNIIKTDNFRTYAKLYTPAANAGEAFPVNNGPLMRQILESITELQFVTDDTTFRDELNSGATVTKRVLPENIAELSNTGDDNNEAVMDFANAVANETEFGNAPGTQVVGGGFPGPQYGPVSYATVKGNLNPPNMTIWAVGRGFPRKKRPTCTARITMWQNVAA